MVNLLVGVFRYHDNHFTFHTWRVNEGDTLCAQLFHIFLTSVMETVGNVKLGRTHLVFVEPHMKINGAYCHDVHLSEEMLPTVDEISGRFSFFNSESACTLPVH